MNKSTRALTGFIIGFLSVLISCMVETGIYEIGGGPLLGGCMLGGLFAIIAMMLGGNNENKSST